MAMIDHLFDNHKYCDNKWCHKKRREEEQDQCNEVGSERNKTGYYRCKIEDEELYDNLVGLYEPYISEDCIIQCKHEFYT